MIIRLEKPNDYRKSEEVTREAFWNHHSPGCDEHYLLHMMREAEVYIPELAMVAEMDGEIAGHIAYAKSEIRGDNGKVFSVITFGPISVLPEYQGQGIGATLIRTTLDKARQMGFSAVIIYGDPAYYSRFGFLPARSFGVATAEDCWTPSLQGIELAEGALSKIGGGRFFEGEIYQIDSAKAKAFDASFVPKQKKTGLSSQKHFAFLISQREPRK